MDYVKLFEKRFGPNINETTLAKAVQEDPLWLEIFISFGNINRLTKAYALCALGETRDDRFIPTLKEYAINDKEPLVREGAFIGLSDYRDNKELLVFFNDSLKQESSPGVKEQIENLLEWDRFYK